MSLTVSPDLEVRNLAVEALGGQEMERATAGLEADVLVAARRGSRHPGAEFQRRIAGDRVGSLSGHRIGQRSVPPEASIVPELVKVVAVTVPNPPASIPRRRSAKRSSPDDVSVPPPSWIRPSLVIAAPAVVHCGPPEAATPRSQPIVRSVVSIALVTPCSCCRSRSSIRAAQNDVGVVGCDRVVA